MTHPQLLTENFYTWEARTRGYQVYPYPVSPEPFFVPFSNHYQPYYKAPDDGRVPGLLDRVKNFFAPPVEFQETEELEDNEKLPDLYAPEGRLYELQITLPKDFNPAKQITTQFLSSLAYVRFPLSFEIIGTHSHIVVQLSIWEADKLQVLNQLKAFLPEAVIVESRNYLTSLCRVEKERFQLVVDFGLEHEGMIPLFTQARFDVDPLVSLIGALSSATNDCVAILQFMFLPVRYPWAECLIDSVTTWDGKPFFADAPQLTKQAQVKIEKPLYGVVIRAGVSSSVKAQVGQILKQIGGALTQFNTPTSNSLIPLNNDGYPDEIHFQDVLDRVTHRSGMLLNADELINFVHFPTSSVKEEKLLRLSGRTKRSPDISLNNSLLLGHNLHNRETREVTLNQDQRMRHMYMVGASGTGKSTLLSNMIIQDIERGEGVAVLDPHGDLVDHVLNFIPKKRLQDVILFNPTDEDYPIGFNVFSAHSETEKTLLSSDLTGVFRRLSTSWGDQMNCVLANGILAMLESSEPATLLTLRRFLIEKDFRKKFLPTVQDPEIVYYWEKEFPLLTGRPQAPVLTRIDTFLRPKPIRYMVAQEKNRIDFENIMDSGKIFLAKLTQGGIGEENSYLMGALIVAKIHQMSLKRQKIEKSRRRPFYLYIDEFQNFVTPSMEAILSGARKYNLALILAHQELRQLASKDREIASSVLSNPYTRICFRLGEADAEALRKGLSFFKREELQSLGTGQAIGRIEQAQFDFNLQTLPMREVEPNKNYCTRYELIDFSRRKYATHKAEVVEKLFATAPAQQPEKKTKKDLREEKPEVKPKIEKPKKPKKTIQVSGLKEKEEKKLEEKEKLREGRGGVQHQYLQQLIKRLAEERGYRAKLEEQVLGGAGLVDVSLSNSKEKIACEISVTTPPEYELKNIQKCLAHGFDLIVILSNEKRHLDKIQKLAEKELEKESFTKLFFLQPEQFIEFLDERKVKPKPKEKIVRGYKIKVKYKSLTKSEEKEKKEAIAKLIVNSMKRMRES